MKEFLHKHGIKILIAILIIFSLNKCTVSCNRGNVIDKQQIEIVQKDSIIKSQSDSLSILKIRWSDAQNSQSTYQGIAIGNQQQLFRQIDSLRNEKNILTQKVSTLTNENTRLKKENDQLKKQITNN